jgi:hypothetical protein
LAASPVLSSRSASGMAIKLMAPSALSYLSDPRALIPTLLRETRPVRERTDMLAGVLADMPEVVAALLRDHVPDARGRCSACGRPGTGTPHVAAPCSLATIAEAARKIRAARPLR